MLAGLLDLDGDLAVARVHGMEVEALAAGHEEGRRRRPADESRLHHVEPGLLRHRRSRAIARMKRRVHVTERRVELRMLVLVDPSARLILRAHFHLLHQCHVSAIRYYLLE